MIGLWLDHAQAHFIDLSKAPASFETVYSNKETQQRFNGEHATGTLLGNNRSTNSEHHLHNRQHEIMEAWYKLLINRLKEYDDIYLFGPTLAKDELYNRLKADKHFSEKTLNVEPAGHMTEKQMVAQVKHFFNV
ncbi:MAG TPA: hypothetical protein VG603_02995 [Chitinophagales bacterium]|nr:hypothetical protein [Chitinophagales bacterium]